MAPRRSLDDWKFVLPMHEGRNSYFEISIVLEISQSTCHDIVQRFTMRGDLRDAHLDGRLWSHYWPKAQGVSIFMGKKMWACNLVRLELCGFFRWVENQFVWLIWVAILLEEEWRASFGLTCATYCQILVGGGIMVWACTSYGGSWQPLPYRREDE